MCRAAAGIHKSTSVRCEGLTAMLLKFEVFWSVTVCLVGCDGVSCWV